MYLEQVKDPRFDSFEDLKHCLVKSLFLRVIHEVQEVLGMQCFSPNRFVFLFSTQKPAKNRVFYGSVGFLWFSVVFL